MALYINGNKVNGGTDVVHLTQAQYDALPSSKNYDGKVYMITDANGDGSQFQPIIYSENEREIGVWVDGKPLYEKTVTFSNVSKSGKAYFGIANSDTIFLKDGYITEVDTMFPYVHGTASANNIGGFIRKEQNNSDAYWEFRGGNDAPSTLSGWMSVRYTKTTDTAGSGTWTPQGVPAVHYSTDEQVIGTWIDGKTIYEKTYDVTTPLTNNANNKIDANFDSSLYYPVSVEATCILSDGINMLNAPYVNLNANPTQFISIFVADGLYVGVKGLLIDSASVTVKYIKLSS